MTEATKGIDTDGILTKNPFRYRGYYYDAETGFYYLNAHYYDPEIRRFISPDDMQYLGAGDRIAGYNLFAYCNNNPIMGYDPTGNWDWGGVLVGAGLMGTATAGVFAAGAVVTCAAATDSVMVVDASGAYGVPLYGKAGMSAVIDFGSDNINLYPHLCGGIGNQWGPSVAVGIVENYEIPDDYKGPSIDVNAAIWLGADHCWDPKKKHGVGAMATSGTFSNDFSFGLGGDWFFEPVQILEW